MEIFFLATEQLDMAWMKEGEEEGAQKALHVGVSTTAASASAFSSLSLSLSEMRSSGWKDREGLLDQGCVGRRDGASLNAVDPIGGGRGGGGLGIMGPFSLSLSCLFHRTGNTPMGEEKEEEEEEEEKGERQRCSLVEALCRRVKRENTRNCHHQSIREMR